ncbi:hypothetical protein BP5796_13152 [Coleophoma crateriformis]|uniref:Uncharacterized protein n=1 Tax=Coleophoma crateriformis TaxID=565419 RepID=A0A3D8Q3R2_9HELO|nr:hypothetical protein BP5796_13152 [Coleophoma crateriformis]
MDEETQAPNAINHRELTSELVSGLRQSNNEQTQFDIQSSILPVIDIDGPNIDPCIVSSRFIDSSNGYGLHERRAGQENPLDADSFYKTYQKLIPYKNTNSFSRQDAIDATMSIILPPSQTLIPGGSHEENLLFYHYVCNISVVMTPIDDGHNPWKSTYPSIAVRDLSSSSTRALYHAILAQSAYFLANVKGPVRGKGENLSAMRYFGMAIRELRESLMEPSKDYISVLAALLTIILGEHVFKATSRGWRNHLQGAAGFVTQYLAQQPWRLSYDAWIITQNFALSYVIAQTVGSCSATAANNNIDIYDVLCDVMARPGFGYTIGATARLIKAIYKARQLEEQMTAAGFSSPSVNFQDMSKNVCVQVEEIIQQLQIPLNDEVEVIMKRQPEPQHRDVVQTRVQLHFHLFNSAVMIYLLRVVLRHPPSAVFDYVWEVLNDTMTFINMGGGGCVSIWPVFIAAAEAYTPKLQEMADSCLIYLEGKVTGNRKDVRRVVHQVWADRGQLVAERQCDPGEVLVDWRAIMKRLDVDILLL